RGGGFRLGERLRAKNVDKRGKAAQPRAQIDDALADDRAKARPAAQIVACKAHVASPRITGPAAFRLPGDVLEVIARTVNGQENRRRNKGQNACPSASRFSTRRSTSCARAMSSSACATLSVRALSMSIAWAFWSA